jgi:hypothetical protein
MYLSMLTFISCLHVLVVMQFQHNAQVANHQCFIHANFKKYTLMLDVVKLWLLCIVFMYANHIK